MLIESHVYLIVSESYELIFKLGLASKFIRAWSILIIIAPYMQDSEKRGRTWMLVLMFPLVLGSMPRIKNLFDTTSEKKLIQAALTLMS